MLPRHDIPALIALRRYKAAYRHKGGAVPPVKWREVQKLIDVVDATFQIGLQTKSVRADVVLANTAAATIPSSWYAKTRGLELALCIARPGPTEVEASKRELLRVLRSPTDYGGFIAQNLSIIQGRVCNVIHKLEG